MVRLTRQGTMLLLLALESVAGTEQGTLIISSHWLVHIEHLLGGGLLDGTSRVHTVDGCDFVKG